MSDVAKLMVNAYRLGSLDTILAADEIELPGSIRQAFETEQEVRLATLNEVCEDNEWTSLDAIVRRVGVK